jgi:purine-binding chemotaxis protein CheW
MNAHDSLDGAAQTTDGGQFLTFDLATAQYAIEILRVQEIRGYSDITPVPNAPRHVVGVMDLRGTIIPVVDLRARLGLPDAARSQVTVIIVVRIGAQSVGVVVDAVSDVLNIDDASAQEVADLGVPCDAGAVTRMAKVGDKLVALLDVDHLLDQAA